MPEKLGIENLKVIIKYGFDIADDVRKAMADGRFKAREALLFIDEGLQLPKVIKKAPIALAEIQDLDVTEKVELDIWVADEFECPTDNVEVLVETCIQAAIAAGDFVVKILNLVEAIKAFKD